MEAKPEQSRGSGEDDREEEAHSWRRKGLAQAASFAWPSTKQLAAAKPPAQQWGVMEKPKMILLVAQNQMGNA